MKCGVGMGRKARKQRPDPLDAEDGNIVRGQRQMRGHRGSGGKRLLSNLSSTVRSVSPAEARRTFDSPRGTGDGLITWKLRTTFPCWQRLRYHWTRHKALHWVLWVEGRRT